VAKKTFQLWVQLVDWHDGDSFKAVLDQGCFVYRGRLDKPIMFRCARIDTPELKVDGVDNPAGLAALDYARRIAPIGEYACLSTGLDEFGRPLLDLVTERGLFSEVMLGSGFAVPYKR
jgi:endonuclease YncB( thermonuclease family)